MKITWLLIPGLMLLACNQKAQKNANVETNGTGQMAVKDSESIKTAAEAAKLTETKIADPMPDADEGAPTDAASVDAAASEPAITTGAPKAEEEKEVSTEDALKHIAPGMADFKCKKANPTTVACQAVDAKRKGVSLPNEAKVEWFASEGTEESLKAVKAELKNDPAAGSSWSIPLDEFLNKPVLARVTRDRVQADIYVTPDD